MAKYKAQDFTRKQIEQAVKEGEFHTILEFGNASSRRIASEVLHETLLGSTNMFAGSLYKSRIEELKKKIVELQQQRDGQVPDPKKYISYEELKGAHGLYVMADFIRCAADRLVELEAQPESQFDFTEMSIDQLIELRSTAPELEVQYAASIELARRRVAETAAARKQREEEQVATAVVEMPEGEELIEPQTPVTNEATEFVNQTLRELGLSELVPEKPAESTEPEDEVDHTVDFVMTHGITQNQPEGDLDPKAPHGGSDNEAGGSDDTTTVDLHDQESSVDDIPAEPAASDSPEPVIKVYREYPRTQPEHDTAYVQSLNATREELGLPGFFDQCDAFSRNSFVWVVNGATRYVKDYAKNIIEEMRSGNLTFEPTKHRFLNNERLQPLDPEPEADANLDGYDRSEVEQIYRTVKTKFDVAQDHIAERANMKTGYERLYEGAKEKIAELEQQLADRETPAEIVSPWYPKKAEEPAPDPGDTLIADLRTKLQESETMRKQVTEAKDKLILRNRELEAENATLKQQLEEALAKLQQYEGMSA
jgi:hypothetical protein